MSDTRSLVRQAYPVLLSQGRTPSCAEIKNLVRQQHPLLVENGWNPSDSTIQSELKKIRITHGQQMLAGATIKGLPEALSEVLVEAGNRIMAKATDIAFEEFEADRKALSESVLKAQTLQMEAEKKSLESASYLQAEIERFNRALTELRVQNASLEVTLHDYETKLGETASNLASCQVLVSERQLSIDALQSQVTQQGKMFEEQTALAESRYRDLEKAKLLEIDGLRQQRDRALAERDVLKLETARIREAADEITLELRDKEQRLAVRDSEMASFRVAMTAVERERDDALRRAEDDRRFGHDQTARNHELVETQQQLREQIAVLNATIARIETRPVEAIKKNAVSKVKKEIKP
jgi:chromosome segregation ATPase